MDNVLQFFSVPRNRRIVAGVLVGTWASKTLVKAIQDKNRIDAKMRTEKYEWETEGPIKKKVRRGGIDKHFIESLKRLLRICIPSWRSKEALLVLLHTSALMSRTFLSVYVSSLDGRIVRTIVNKDSLGFAKMLALWLGVAIPATYVNSIIKLFEGKIALAFRTRLVKFAYAKYMASQTYYTVGNMDSRLRNPDQLLTEDIRLFCENAAHVYSQLSKPLLDVVFMSAQLYRLDDAARGGAKDTRTFVETYQTTALAVFAVFVTSFSLRMASPPFGRMVAEKARRAGDLRAAHSRLMRYSEEVAFYGGHEIEEGVLHKAYNRLASHINLILKKRIPYTMLEQFFMKYVWSAVGLLTVAIPTFQMQRLRKEGGVKDDTASERTENFVTARNLLRNAADAIERIMSSYKEVTELSGYTTRVEEMFNVFDDCKEGKYKKNMNTNLDPIAFGTGESKESDCEVILENVPIVTPAGDVLTKSLSIDITPGRNVLICGPNGCGKSSFFRTLCGLWPVRGGSLTRPTAGSMFYIPQRAYFTRGSFRQQIIYPDTDEAYHSKGGSDEHLESLLKSVTLHHVLEEAEGGWDYQCDWQEVLSGGDKQRLAMARLFYHNPKFAILDECTSACSMDVEAQMYLKAKELGITLLTVSHRVSLWKYHDYVLRFDGSGGWAFEPLDVSDRIHLESQKTLLEDKLRSLPQAIERLELVCEELDEDSDVLATVQSLGEAEI